MIANQREATAGKLHPDLMTASCVKTDMHQAGFPSTQTVKFQTGQFHAFAFFLTTKTLFFRLSLNR